jgi:hypothetical protein
MIDTLWESPRVAVNLLGHGAGVLIFGIFLVLVFRHSSLQRLRASHLSLIAAGLAFLWNLLSLAILGSGDSVGLTQRVIAGASFCVLSFLPAVLLALRQNPTGGPFLGHFPESHKFGPGCRHALSFEQ